MNLAIETPGVLRSVIFKATRSLPDNLADHHFRLRGTFNALVLDPSASPPGPGTSSTLLYSGSNATLRQGYRVGSALVVPYTTGETDDDFLRFREAFQCFWV